MFMTSSSTVEIPIMSTCAFPLASTLGIMAIIVPSGIGVREVIIVCYLSFVGFSKQEATTI